MNQRERTLLASAGVVGIFLVIQLGALALVELFYQEGHQVAEDTADPSLSILYIIAILVVTALMLAALKYGGADLLRLFIIFAGAYIAWFVFDALVPSLVTIDVGGIALNVPALAGAFALGVLLYLYPEWYVIDAAGIIMGIGAAGLFGINLDILPVLVLLIGLAVYDAISVYGTKHMLALASGAMEMRVPVVLVIPLSLSYSFLDDDDLPDPASEETTDPDEDADTDRENTADEPLDAAALEALSPEEIAALDEDELAALDPDTLAVLDDETRERVREALPSRDALFIGLGDAIIPTVLVASAAFFVDAPTVALPFIAPTVPALTAMAGTIAGLLALLWLVSKGRAHAGLPLLNGGAIAGYLVGALLSGLTLVEALGISGFV